MITLMPGAEPFAFDGNHVGCIVTHGFTGTPKEVCELGQRLASAGYSVRGPLLPGHGTTPEDMERTTWQGWYSAVEAAYDDLSARCDHVFAIGLSMGGMLSLYLAAHRPVAGVVPMATPILAPDWRLHFVGLSRHFVRFWPKGDEDSNWFDPVAEERHISYDVNPSKSATEIKKLFPELNRVLHQVTAPALLIYSRNDLTVRAQNAALIYDRIASTDKSLVWVEKSCHVVTEDLERETVFATVLDFVTRITSESTEARSGKLPVGDSVSAQSSVVRCANYNI